MNLLNELEKAEAHVAALRREIAAGPCHAYSHDWKHIGGRNAGCDDGCNCSVPVHTCQKCGDCDYGENAEAVETIAECARESA